MNTFYYRVIILQSPACFSVDVKGFLGNSYINSPFKEHLFLFHFVHVYNDYIQRIHACLFTCVHGECEMCVCVCQYVCVRERFDRWICD